MAAPTQAEVGPVYDVILATRDGSTLPCRNKDGQVVSISSLGLVTSASAQNQQHEETELQHKDSLIQLSGNLIDREFSQWPQITQGDWSGGGLQRVLTGGTPLTSFGPQSDPSRYWDGQGVLWPVTDYLPQQPVLATADQNEGGNQMKSWQVGAVAGPLVNLVAGVQAFVYAYQQSNAPNNNIMVIQEDGTTKHTITNFPVLPGVPGANVIDYIIAFGRVWLLTSLGAGTCNLEWTDGTGAAFTSVMTIATSQVDTVGGLAAAVVGNKAYIAFVYRSTAAGGAVNLRIVDVTLSTYATFSEQPLWTIQTAQIQVNVQQIEFFGDTLLVAVGSRDQVSVSGSEAVLLQYSIPGGTWTTLARFPHTSNLYFCPIQGSVFILATNDTNAISPNSVDMYLLQGSSLQHIGPLITQASNQAQNFILGETIPTAWGPYAVFTIWYEVSVSVSRAVVFAYDVLRGRLFKLNDIGPYSAIAGTTSGRRMAIVNNFIQHPFAATTLGSQWATIVPVLGNPGGASPSDITNVQRLLSAVSASAFASPFLQQGTQITSSLIDFTSAQPKLFRQVIATWAQPGLPSDTAITVKLDVWLDQDPASLASVPDFTTGAVAAGVNGGVLGQTRLVLLINKVATKVVYRITTIGPSNTLTPAVKLVSVIVRAATGWTRTMFFDLADNALTNGKNPNATVWSRQQPVNQPALDGTAAYNFTRQLWRLKGGEVTATFPNGDAPADWLLEDIHWDSPKPFGSSFRADQRSGLGYVCQIKLREDI